MMTFGRCQVDHRHHPMICIGTTTGSRSITILITSTDIGCCVSTIPTITITIPITSRVTGCCEGCMRRFQCRGR